MPGTNACQMSASLSVTGIWVSAPASSNRHNVTLLATLEATAKCGAGNAQVLAGRGAEREQAAGQRDGGAGIRGGPGGRAPRRPRWRRLGWWSFLCLFC